MTTPYAKDYSWLHRQPLKQINGSEKTVNAVMASAAVVADDDARKLLAAGTVVCQITSGDEINKWGPYLKTATDGRESPAAGKTAVLVEPLDVTLYDLPFAGYIADCVLDLSELTLGGMSNHGATLTSLKAALPQATFWD